MLHTLFSVLRDDDGVTMVEYALMLMLIALVCIGVVTLIGTTLSGFFNGVGPKI